MATTSEAIEPRPAATVILLRDTVWGVEVLLVQRHQAARFMGGAHVFPGGRVDRSDRDMADERWCDGLAHATAQLSALPPADAVAFHIAAVRELFEEAGILLARDRDRRVVALGAAERERFTAYRHDVHSAAKLFRDVLEREHLRAALDALVLFAHWVTPIGEARRFDTRFFVARMPPDQSFAHDERETIHSEWMTPADALAQGIGKAIVLPPPTWTTLRELEQFESSDQAIAWSRGRTILRREPVVVEHNGARTLLLPGDPLHPMRWPDAPPRETRFVHAQGSWRADRPDLDEAM